MRFDEKGICIETILVISQLTELLSVSIQKTKESLQFLWVYCLVHCIIVTYGFSQKEQNNIHIVDVLYVWTRTHCWALLCWALLSIVNTFLPTSTERQQMIVQTSPEVEQSWTIKKVHFPVWIRWTFWRPHAWKQQCRSSTGMSSSSPSLKVTMSFSTLTSPWSRHASRGSRL